MSSAPGLDKLVYDPTLGGPGFGAFVEAARSVMDELVWSAPPPDELRELTLQLEQLAGRLAAWHVLDAERWTGRRPDLPGYGNPLLLPVVYDSVSAHTVRGHVVFRPFHVGGHLAAHGGTQPLLFDDVLGRLANYASRVRARTATLTVNYRKVTPLDVPLRVEATIDRRDGRKLWVSGRLYEDGGDLLSDATALFVELRPGQP